MPDYGPMAVTLLGGLALFLFGMQQLSDALKLLAGDALRRMIGRVTVNRFVGAIFGAGITGIIQSSSVTTVLLVGFISAGLMSLSQAVPVIMGANIGSTFTAQIIAFKVTESALVLVAIGFALQFLARKARWKQIGGMVMGLGLVFFGMNLMSEATDPLRSYQPFIDLMASMQNPLWGILIGAAFTALVQSSAATTGIVIVLAGQGVITLDAGIALVFGANIGTCVTGVLAAIGKPREAQQAAGVHVLFNVIGVLIWIPFIDDLAMFVRLISPVAVTAEGIAKRAAELPRQIANAHTIFNVANTVLFIGFTGPTAALIRKILPDRKASEKAKVEASFLDRIYLETPSMAIERVRLELTHLGRRLMPMLQAAIPAVMHGSREELHAINRMDEKVDRLHAEIFAYVGQLPSPQMSDIEKLRIAELTFISNSMESLGDMIETNMVAQGLHRVEKDVSLDEQTQKGFAALQENIVEAFEMSLKALAENDVDLAMRVIEMKDSLNEQSDALSMQIARGIRHEAGESLDSFRIASDLIELLKREYYLIKRIAKKVVKLDHQDEKAIEAPSS